MFQNVKKISCIIAFPSEREEGASMKRDAPIIKTTVVICIIIIYIFQLSRSTPLVEASTGALREWLAN